MQNYSIVDVLIILLYLGVIFALAFRSRNQGAQRKNLVEEHYLAGRSTGLWSSIFSIVATEASALTFLAVPGYAFKGTYAFLHIYLGATLGRIIIAYIVLPKIYAQELTIYGSMTQERATTAGRRSLSLFYSMNKFLTVGVRLYSGSILIATFFNLDIYLAVGLIVLITFFYTMIGGLKAVIRTDVLQFFIFVLGAVVAHFTLSHLMATPWIDLMGKAYHFNKMTVFDFSDPWPLILGLLAGFTLDICTHGIDQDFAQRLTSCKNLKTAQRSIMLSSLCSIAVGALFLGIGSLLWNYYLEVPVPELKTDYLFAHFITHHFPLALRGLMVAGLLAASMSTLDSSINAISSCWWNDLWPHRNPQHIKKYVRRDTLFISLIFLLIAFLAEQSDDLLNLGLSIGTWIYGAMGALFFTQMLFPRRDLVRLDALVVCSAFIFGALAVYVNMSILKLSWHYNISLGFITSCLVVYTWGITRRVFS